MWLTMIPMTDLLQIAKKCVGGITQCNLRTSYRDSNPAGQDRSARQHAQDIIQSAKASKARILATPGNFDFDHFESAHSAMVDENYGEC